MLHYLWRGTLGALLGRILDVHGEQLGKFIESIRQRNEIFEI